MMNERQQHLNDLRDIEVDTIKEEKNFDFRTALMKVFKAVYRLFESKEDVSKEDMVNAAKRQSERLGLGDRYNWNKIFGLKEVNQSVEQQDKQLTFANGNPYPDNFYIGQAIANGSCFFDAFRQGVEQQKGIKVTVEQLRRDCQEFAQKNPPQWFIQNIGNDWEESRNGFVNRGITSSQYTRVIKNNWFWGRPDIEGRILCEKYKVNLDVSEYNPITKNYEHTVSGPEYIRKTYSSKADEIAERNPKGEVCSVSMNGEAAYKLNNTIHIINKGGLHFEPLLDRNKSLTRRPKEQTQEQKDFLLARQLQEKKDYLLAVQLQRQEYNSLKRDNEKNTFQEKDSGYAGELLAKILQREGRAEFDCFVKAFLEIHGKDLPKHSPNCNVQAPRLTHHQQHIQQTIKGC